MPVQKNNKQTLFIVLTGCGTTSLFCEFVDEKLP